MASNTMNKRLLDQMAYGFWVRTKQAPHRAVRWAPQRHDDGRESFRGKGWTEVLEHGEDREPEQFYGADVELVGPHEWLDYYPATNEPVCGWGRPRLPKGEMQYCPRRREEGEPWCRLHMHELGEETNARAGEADSHPE